MTWAVLLALLGVAVVATVAWALGRPRPAAADAPPPDPDTFRPQLRGYRMEQVDAVVDRLEARVAQHDRAIAALRGEVPPPAEGTRVAAEEPPPEGGPAAARHTSAAGRPARDAARPLPLRRSDLLAPLAYLLTAVWVMSGLLAAPRTGHLSQGVQDQQAFEWYFGATAHNLVTFSNPLFSDLQNYPEGVNLMANASVLGLGVPLAPVTLLAGPQWTFILVELLGLALTATAWFWLFRRHLAVHPLAAALGAGFAGFAPGLVSHANGHPNFVAQFLVPLILDRLLRLAGPGGRTLRDGVVLGLLVVWQVFIGEEVLLLTALGVLVGGLVLLAHGRVEWRRFLPGVGLGAALAGVLVAFPLWWQFAGPRSYGSIWHPPAGNDLTQLWGRATRSLGADPWASAAVSMNRTEENSFFGIPLLVAALLVSVVLWRRVEVRALAVVVVVACWLSLGEEVTVAGEPTGVPGPWALLERLPVVENVLPTRLTLIAVPALGALLALGTEQVRRRVARAGGGRGAGLAVAGAAAALVLLPVVPTPLVVEPRAPMPQFFRDGSWREWVDEGGSVLAAPPPWVADTRALEWQAEARWGFPVVAGYFVGPDPSPERTGQYGATPTAFTQWLGEITTSNVARRASDGEVETFEEHLRAGRVDAVVLPEARPEAAALLRSLTDVLGEPTVHTGGVYLWDVRTVTDGAG
ncbi:DivIVA domain-containing protein [Oryzobacter sp. R7]|uniref:DivIVA domain-containing protein n=1 Tax=Oryzobacter faecalis TaxID=3388656 RepID=UPI00398D1D88